MLLLVLVFASSLLTSAEPKSAPCAACNYNGQCTAGGGACACYRGWAGSACDALDLVPVNGTLGYQHVDDATGQNVSSWGGSVLVDEDGLFHMYAAEMGLFCGINTWLSNSIVIHATSPDPTRVPFSRASVVQGAFAHEPIAARASTGEFVVFFSAVLPPNPLPVRGGQPCAGCANGISVAKCGTDSNRNASVMLPTYMVYSENPDGPWTAPAMIPGTDVFADSNFAPWINADGTLVALTRHQVWHAADWRNVTTYSVVGTWSDTGEDPFIWRDSNAVFHNIIHRGRPNTTGLHYYSLDGRQWTPAADAAYTSVVNFTDGSSVNLACRERPHIVLNAAGDPIALTNGAARITCHAAGADDRSVTFLQVLK